MDFRLGMSLHQEEGVIVVLSVFLSCLSSFLTASEIEIVVFLRFETGTWDVPLVQCPSLVQCPQFFQLEVDGDLIQESCARRTGSPALDSLVGGLIPLRCSVFLPRLQPSLLH
jgi:hypothetical protein